MFVLPLLLPRLLPRRVTRVIALRLVRLRPASRTVPIAPMSVGNQPASGVYYPQQSLSQSKPRGHILLDLDPRLPLSPAHYVRLSSVQRSAWFTQTRQMGILAHQLLLGHHRIAKLEILPEPRRGTRRSPCPACSRRRMASAPGSSPLAPRGCVPPRRRPREPPPPLPVPRAPLPGHFRGSSSPPPR